MTYEDYQPALPTTGPGRFGSLAKLATALAKAQSEIDDANKDSTNPHFKSKYADLASVRAAIRKPLSDNGLAYVQLLRTAERGVEVETILIHGESGEAIGETLQIPLQQMTPQTVGSGISYGRRYSLMAIIGIAADDDDGENAENRHGNGGRTPAKRTQKDISATAARKWKSLSEIETDLSQIESTVALATYERETLTPEFMESLGTKQFAVVEWVESRRAELSEPVDDEPEAVAARPYSRADFIRDCHEKIAAFTDEAKLLTWWNGDKATRKRFALTKDESGALMARVMDRRETIRSISKAMERDLHPMEAG